MSVTPDASPSYRRLFSIEGFSRLVSGMILARTANTMVSLVLVLFALDRFHTATVAGLVAFLSLAPGLVLSPIAGALLDRHGRTRLMVFDYCVAAACLALIVVLGATNVITEALLLAIVTVMSLTFPLSTTGVRTLFPLLVPRPLWERANAIDSNGYVVSSIFGPAIAGGLVATVGSLWALALTSVMYAVAAFVTSRLRDPLGVVPHGGLIQDAWAGLVYVVRHPTLRGLAITISTANIAGGLFYIGLPVLVLLRLGGDAARVGQLFTLQGLTAAVSVLLVGRFGTAGRERELMAGSILLQSLGYLIALLAPDLLIVGVAMLVLGIATGPFDVVLFTMRQRRTDPAWLGRAFAVSMSLNFIGFPVGTAIGGAIAAGSVEAVFAAAVALTVIAAAITFFAVPKE
ncbi:MAG: MFS transporter [Chloroflexi bacterium]|nr:MAG: MFS transporter [Chloroflexota bacterium]